MTQRSPRTRRLLILAGGLAACGTFIVASSDPAMARRTKVKIAKSLNVVVHTPLGLQGTAGAGARSALPIVITDRSRRRVNVEVEFGIDLDGDGEIADGTDESKPSEYRRATHRRRDSRDTSRVKSKPNGKPAVTYRPSREGATHAFVWDNLADLGRNRVRSGAQIVRDDTGRVQFDPFERDQPLFTDDLPGVVLRARAIRRGGKRQRTEWVYSDPFSVDNSLAPSATIDGVGDVDLAAGVVELAWTAFDDDSEDANGNGVLDVLDLEDRNGNGVLDAAPVSIAFDHHRLSDGERVPSSVLDLAALDWRPCTRAAGAGDSDVGIASAPSGIGREALFVWDFHADRGDAELAAGRYLVRCTPYDDLGNLGVAFYLDEPIVIGSLDD